MLDAFMKVAYAQSKADDERDQTVALMRKLPQETLYKIATGQINLNPALTKTASDVEWLEDFKGTPLFSKAVELEQQSINIEMMRQQRNEQRDQEQNAQPDLSAMESKLHLQKKMLALELATQQLQQSQGAEGAAGGAPATPEGPAAPVGGAQGSGAPGPETEPAGPKLGSAHDEANRKVSPHTQKTPPGKLTLEEALAAGLLGGPGGYFGAKKGKEHSGEAFEGGVRGVAGHLLGAFPGAALGTVVGGGLGQALGGTHGGEIGAGLGSLAGQVGGGLLGYKMMTRKYDGAGGEKQAADELVTNALELGQKLAHVDMAKVAKFNAGMELGSVMAKSALDLGGLAGKAVGFAKEHPGAAIGGALGAAGGLAHGLQKDEHGQRHLLGGLAEGAIGGAGGAAVGHVAQGTHYLMGQGRDAGDALRTAGGALANKVRAHVGNAAANIGAGARDLLGKIRGPEAPAA